MELKISSKKYFNDYEKVYVDVKNKFASLFIDVNMRKIFHMDKLKDDFCIHTFDGKSTSENKSIN